MSTNSDISGIERLQAHLQDAHLVIGEQLVALRRYQAMTEQLQAQVEQLQFQVELLENRVEGVTDESRVAEAPG